MNLNEKVFENIVVKGENDGDQHFLLSQQCFLTFPNQGLISYSNLFCRLQMLSIWTQYKILSFGKELRYIMES